MKEKMDFFRVENLGISFGGLKALSDLNFTVREGEIYAVIGPNGAGKTTLFNCISGIYKADQGSIVFRDQKINGLRPDQIARLKIARTFQNIELFQHMTCMENILLGSHLYMKTGLFRGMFLWGRNSFAGKEEQAFRYQAEQIIDFLELQAVRNKFVGALPFGVQKLIELGRALALKPDLLLLDEPSAGMNAEERQNMIFWIKDIQEEFGVTVLIIEHDMNMIMEISDRILVLNFGGVIAEGVPSLVQSHPEVLKAYLGEE